MYLGSIKVVATFRAEDGKDVAFVVDCVLVSIWVFKVCMHLKFYNCNECYKYCYQFQKSLPEKRSLLKKMIVNFKIKYLLGYL